MKSSSDRDLIIKYIDAESYDALIEYAVDRELLKQIEKIASNELVHTIYIFLLFAEFEAATNGFIEGNNDIQKQGLRLQSELKRFGDIMKLSMRDIQEISFTIRGRKMDTTIPEVKMALAKALKKIQQANYTLPAKKTTKPPKPETNYIKALIPLAKFLKYEHSLIDADIYRHIQKLLSLKGFDVELDFIRQRLHSSLK